MKTYQRFLLQGAISFLIPPILFAGCSLIGFGIGALSDSGKRGGQAMAGLAELRASEKGTGIVLFTRDGAKMEGDFVGIHELNRREYDRLYLAAVETLNIRDQLPMPGDSISFEYNDPPGKKVRGIFRGVDLGLLVLWQPAGKVSLSGIRTLKGIDARPLDLFALRVLADDGHLPGISAGVLIERRSDTTEVPVEDIVRIERDAGGNGKLTGFLVGAVIDAVVLIAAANSAESCNHDVWHSNDQSCHSNRDVR